MASPIVPALLRSTVGRMRVQGVPRILAQTSRWILGTTPQMLPVAGGYRLHIDPRDPDQCMMYYGFYGGGILHCAGELLESGDTVLDIGGQIGFFAAAFAGMVGSSGRVITFEPDPRVWPRLTAGCRSNPDLCIDPWNAAVGATSGSATLHVSPTAGWSTLLDCDYDEVEAVEVTVHALDDLHNTTDLGWDRLRLIKLDVEGMEIPALEGMRQVIHRRRPHLLCEMNLPCLKDSGRSPDDLLDLLADLGYQIQAIVEPRGILRNAPPRRIDVTGAGDLPWSVGDLWCIPHRED